MLYLIPTPIAEAAMHTLPEQVLEVVRGLDVFIVERAKTARHFVKAAGPPRPISELVFVELPREGGLGEVEMVLKSALQEGKDVGVLSEAGCPGIADPGAAVVAWAHRHQMTVVPLVGPSSIVLSLMGSGFNGQQFAFHGYLPPKRPELGKELKRLEQAVRQTGATQLFIETPYRTQMVLEVAVQVLHPGTGFGIAQDLTGSGQWIRVQSIGQWKKEKIGGWEKLPAVFMLGNL
jgi:16S rRNA (cytidine1402-2'-O)-methyltransferase